MAIWYTIAGTGSSTGGDNLSGDTIDVTITPVNPDTGVHSGFNMKAADFKIGGATETDGSGSATSDTGIWEGGNVDTGISKVQFTDLGIAGNINNTVRARVTFGSTTPSADATYYIDIDEKTVTLPDGSTGDAISNNPSRSICFFLKVTYHANITYGFYIPTTNTTTWTELAASGGDITRTLVNSTTAEADGYYKYKFEGSITNYNEGSSYPFVRVLARRKHLGAEIDPLPGAGDPVFTTHDFYFTGSTPQLDIPDQGQSWANFAYAYAYILNNASINNSDNLSYAEYLDINLNPVDSDFALDNEAGDVCSLGHTIVWDLEIFDPPEVVDLINPVIKSIQIPSSFGSAAGYHDIIVRGTRRAKYTPVLYKTSSTTTTQPASTLAYYNFQTNSFQTNKPTDDNYEIPSSNGQPAQITHSVLMPSASAETRYELYLEPIANTEFSSTIPTMPGDNPIVQEGTHTITLTATAGTANNWDLSPAVTASFTRRPGQQITSTTGSKTNQSTSATCGATLSSGTVLQIKTPNPAIREGMYVMTPFNTNGVPHLTTVARVNETNITLSAASTIASGSVVKFEEPGARIFPFALAIPAGQGADSDYQDLSVQTGNDYKPQSAIGGTQGGSSIVLTVDSNVSAATLIPIREDVYNVVPGMVARASGISSLSGDAYVKITSISTISSPQAINLSEAVTMSAGTQLIVGEDPSTSDNLSTAGVTILHVQGDITTSHGSPAGSQEVGTISGYLNVDNINNSVSLPVHIESVLKATEVS
tara:strand:+ start:8938 stop:11232 length:2295 start_codon:yes stop_codon:yes gene_type:complete